ncbi:MAG TPA: RraA family protein [Chthoniobacter sp.]|jgi:regulator of RNase E activity RraA
MRSHPSTLASSELEALRCLDTCLVANAIETFEERLRSEGYADNSVRCLLPQLGVMVGYAATIKVRGSAVSTTGYLYGENTAWWDYLNSLPQPRVVVVQDVSTKVGLGSYVGAVHANMFKAMGCLGVVTNGSVRDLAAAEAMAFHLFAHGVAVSHAYMHVVDFDCSVEIAGLTVRSGALLHGDQHGFQTIPRDLVSKIPDAAEHIRKKEEAIIHLCKSPEFSVGKLREMLAKR